MSWVRALLTVIQCQASQRWIGRGPKAATWGTNASRRVPNDLKGTLGGSQCSQERQLHSSKVPKGSQRRQLHSLKVPKGGPEAPKTTVTQFARSQRVPNGAQVGHNAPRDDSCTVSKVYKSQLEQLGFAELIKTRGLLHKLLYQSEGEGPRTDYLSSWVRGGVDLGGLCPQTPP